VVTGELKSKIDQIWNASWSGAPKNSELLFLRLLMPSGRAAVIVPDRRSPRRSCVSFAR
jgi:hypothetical protein